MELSYTGASRRVSARASVSRVERGGGGGGRAERLEGERNWRGGGCMEGAEG